jgi:hypothetical protein
VDPEFPETSYKLREHTLRTFSSGDIDVNYLRMPSVDIPLVSPQKDIPCVSVVDLDIADAVATLESPGGVVVSPSQFNGAEYPSHSHVPAKVIEYHQDQTAGPAAQLAVDHSVAQFILDNAANDRNPRGINGVKGLLQLLNKRYNLSSDNCFKLINGYLKFPQIVDKTQRNRILSDIRSNLHLLNVLSATGVKARGGSLQPLDMIYGSAVPVGCYCNESSDADQKKFHSKASRYLVTAQYYLALSHAVAKVKSGGATQPLPVLLTSLGTGVFANSVSDTMKALGHAIEMIPKADIDLLNIRLVIGADPKRNRKGEFEEQLGKLGKLHGHPSVSPASLGASGVSPSLAGPATPDLSFHAPTPPAPNADRPSPSGSSFRRRSGPRRLPVRPASISLGRASDFSLTLVGGGMQVMHATQSERSDDDKWVQLETRLRENVFPESYFGASAPKFAAIPDADLMMLTVVNVQQGYSVFSALQTLGVIAPDQKYDGKLVFSLSLEQVRSMDAECRRIKSERDYFIEKLEECGITGVQLVPSERAFDDSFNCDPMESSVARRLFQQNAAGEDVRFLFPLTIKLQFDDRRAKQDFNDLYARLGFKDFEGNKKVVNRAQTVLAVVQPGKHPSPDATTGGGQADIILGFFRSMIVAQEVLDIDATDNSAARLSFDDAYFGDLYMKMNSRMLAESDGYRNAVSHCSFGDADHVEKRRMLIENSLLFDQLQEHLPQTQNARARFMELKSNCHGISTEVNPRNNKRTLWFTFATERDAKSMTTRLDYILRAVGFNGLSSFIVKLPDGRFKVGVPASFAQTILGTPEQEIDVEVDTPEWPSFSSARAQLQARVENAVTSFAMPTPLCLKRPEAPDPRQVNQLIYGQDDSADFYGFAQLAMQNNDHEEARKMGTTPHFNKLFTELHRLMDDPGDLAVSIKIDVIKRFFQDRFPSASLSGAATDYNGLPILEASLKRLEMLVYVLGNSDKPGNLQLARGTLMAQDDFQCCNDGLRGRLDVILTAAKDGASDGQSEDLHQMRKFMINDFLLKTRPGYYESAGYVNYMAYALRDELGFVTMPGDDQAYQGVHATVRQDIPEFKKFFFANYPRFIFDKLKEKIAREVAGLAADNRHGDIYTLLTETYNIPPVLARRCMDTEYKGEDRSKAFRPAAFEAFFPLMVLESCLVPGDAQLFRMGPMKEPYTPPQAHQPGGHGFGHGAVAHLVGGG